MSPSKCEVRAEITYRVYNVAIGYSFKEKALLCPSVGIGRQSGLRNRGLNGLRVRVSPWVQREKQKVIISAAVSSSWLERRHRAEGDRFESCTVVVK